jgi:DNA polymerase I-like protein with 3'-5' exonuclease and polymerase domains
VIVKSHGDYQEMMKFIKESGYLAYDVESTGLNVRKDKVIGFGVSNHEDNGFYLPILVWDDELQELIKTDFDPLPILEAIKETKLIMWNASYDVRITKNDLGVDLLDSLFSECMLMKHTLIEDGRFALKGTAIEFANEIGFDAESVANKEQLELKENLESKGAGKKEFYKADLSILGTYCISDCTLTFKLFRYFHKRLEDEGLVDFFFDEEVMPLYKTVTIPMEDNGVRIDMDMLNKYNDEIIKDIAQHKIDIIKSLLEIPETQEVINDMATKKYPTKTSGAFAQKVVEVFGLDLPKTKAGKYSLTEKNLIDLSDSKAKQFLLKEISMPEDKATQISRAIYEEKNDELFNIGSRTQMKTLMFDKLKLKPLSKTDKGQPQFNADFIESIADDYPWASKLSNYNKLCKIQSSYFQRFLDKQEDGYYYFSYKQHGTISGRYGSDSQQMPRVKGDGELPGIVLKYNNAVRTLLVPDSGNCYINDDYESAEPHIFAHISNDEGLRDIFRKKHDFYSTIAIATENLPQYSADKKAENYLGKMDKAKRQAAKAYSLGLAYGMSPYALGKTLDISTKEATKLANGYMNSYPNLKKWMEDSMIMAKTKGYVKSEAGRIRHLPKVMSLYKKHGDKLGDWKYKKALEARLGKSEVMYMIMDWKNGLNNSLNFQIQSLGASIINRSMVEIAKRFKQENIPAKIIAQVHDEVMVECTEEVKEEVKIIVKHCMENTYKISLNLTADAEVCYNWDGH